MHDSPDAPFAFGRALAAARRGDGWQPAGLIAPLPSERDTLPDSLFARNVVPSSGAVIRTDSMRAVGGYDTSLAFSEDHDLWLRLAGRGRPVPLAHLVLIHRRHGGNRHVSSRAQQDDDTITRRFGDLVGVGAQRSARLGLQLCEESLSAVRDRDVSELSRVGRRLLLSGPDRRAIVRSAGRHFRLRRAARAAAVRCWAEDDDLWAWLATYD